jgi:hypothetical protein
MSSSLIDGCFFGLLTGWLLRAGQGLFAAIGDRAGAFEMGTPHANFMLATYDQNPDADCVR